MKRTIVVVMSLFIFLAACGQLSGDVLTFKTANPGLTLHFRLLPAPPAPAIEPQVIPCDPVIKGNIASDGTKIAHSPGQANYDNVVIDEAKGEKLFCTLEQAAAEGWRAAQR